MKTAKRTVKAITERDLIGISLEEMMKETYGPKGSAKRKAAEKKIRLIAENLVLSNTLKEIREDRKRSQAQVATVMDVDNSVISKLEKNFEKAQLGTILRYAKALKAKSVNIVFEFEEQESRALHLTT